MKKRLFLSLFLTASALAQDPRKDAFPSDMEITYHYSQDMNANGFSELNPTKKGPWTIEVDTDRLSHDYIIDKKTKERLYEHNVYKGKIVGLGWEYSFHYHEWLSICNRTYTGFSCPEREDIITDWRIVKNGAMSIDGQIWQKLDECYHSSALVCYSKGVCPEHWDTIALYPSDGVVTCKKPRTLVQP